MPFEDAILGSTLEALANMTSKAKEYAKEAKKELEALSEKASGGMLYSKKINKKTLFDQQIRLRKRRKKLTELKITKIRHI